MRKITKAARWLLIFLVLVLLCMVVLPAFAQSGPQIYLPVVSNAQATATAAPPTTTPPADCTAKVTNFGSETAGINQPFTGPGYFVTWHPPQTDSEVKVLVENGQSGTLIGESGTLWEYNATCSMDDIHAQYNNVPARAESTLAQLHDAGRVRFPGDPTPTVPATATTISSPTSTATATLVATRTPTATVTLNPTATATMTPTTVPDPVCVVESEYDWSPWEARSRTGDGPTIAVVGWPEEGESQIKTLIPHDKRGTLLNAAGHGWKYSNTCTAGQLQAELDRITDKSFVAFQDLVNQGKAVWGDPPIATMTPTATATAVSCPEPTHLGPWKEPRNLQFNFTTIADMWWVVNGENYEVMVLVKDYATFIGVRGEGFQYLTSCTDAELQAELERMANERQLPIVTVDDLIVRGLATRGAVPTATPGQ